VGSNPTLSATPYCGPLGGPAESDHHSLGLIPYLEDTPLPDYPGSWGLVRCDCGPLVLDS
jgi:hypothetical protein